VSGIGEPPAGTTPPPGEPPPGGEWPQQDFNEPPWDVKADGNRRRPTTSEQAVPWLIGLVLALAGMLIVLLALIFSSDDGLLPAYGTASPEPTLALTPTPLPSPSPTPEPTATPEPSATPAPTPAFAPLEILFMERVSDGGPIHLFSHDFAGQATPEPLARDNRGVEHYAWAPNGARGVALVAGNPLELNPGNSAIDLGDGFDGIAIAADSTTAWGVRATLAGGNDRAELLQLNLDSGAVQSVATWTYPHPITYQENAIKEAAFADDGGLNRVYVLEDGRVVVWILGAPQIYTWDPATATASTIGTTPSLWSPNGELQVLTTESGSSSSLTVKGLGGETRATATVTGSLSHLRWSSLNNQIVVTLTNASRTGALQQDLYLWDITSGHNFVRLTQDARSMGGSFRGVEERWRP